MSRSHSLRSRLAILVALAALSGCGSDQSGEEVAKSWTAAVNTEDWKAACDLMDKPSTDCESRLAESFAEKDVRLLPAGRYRSGSDVTDNKTKFAVTTDKDDTGYFEIVDRDEPRVDLQVILQAADG